MRTYGMAKKFKFELTIGITNEVDFIEELEDKLDGVVLPVSPGRFDIIWKEIRVKAPDQVVASEARIRFARRNSFAIHGMPYAR